MLFLTALILLNYETLHRATGLWWREKLILKRKKISARVKRHVNEGVNLSAENSKQQPDGVAFGLGRGWGCLSEFTGQYASTLRWDEWNMIWWWNDSLLSTPLCISGADATQPFWPRVWRTPQPLPPGVGKDEGDVIIYKARRGLPGEPCRVKTECLPALCEK